MAGLVPAIHHFVADFDHKDVDARDKPGHDEKVPGKTGAFCHRKTAADKNQRE
jgi:hypothetical protein